MAYTLTLYGATKIATTLEQKDALVRQGWVLTAGGSADDTTLLSEFPFNIAAESDPMNMAFRGIGRLGEGNTLGALVKAATPEMTQEEFTAVAPILNNVKDADAFTSVVTVSAKPAEPAELTVYVFLETDGECTAGCSFIYNDGHWIAYTPGDVFNPDYGAEYKLGLLAGYVDSQDFAALPIATENTKSAIEAILLSALQTVVNEGEAKAYTVSFVSSAYVTATGVWGGKFKVVKDDDADDNATDATARTLLFGAFVNMKLVTDEAITTVPVGTADTKAGVEAAMLVLATAAVGEGYAVTVNATPTSTYDTGTNAWAGKLKVVETANATTNLFVDATARAITVVIAEA